MIVSDATSTGTENLRSQEISIVLTSDLGREVLSSKVVLVTLWSLCGKLISLLLEQLQSIILGDFLALGGRYAVLAPLPQL